MKVVACLLLFFSAACLATLSTTPKSAWIHMGSDDYLAVAPFEYGDAALLRNTGLKASDAAALRARTRRQINNKFGQNFTIEKADGYAESADGSYILEPISVRHPYRVFALRDGWGLLREIFTEKDRPTTALGEYTTKAATGRFVANKNYTGAYKGPMGEKDIIAAGTYFITQPPLFGIGKPTVIEIRMLSLTPGMTLREGSTATRQIIVEHFALDSPQYGKGIAILQIIIDYTEAAMGLGKPPKYFMSNNFHFPAPSGVDVNMYY